MIALKRLGFLAFLLMGFVPVAQAHMNDMMSDEDRVQTIVSEVLEHYKNHGAEATLDRVNRGWTLDGEFYAFINRVSDLTIVAHAANPGFVGKSGDVVQDITTTATETGTWIEYTWVNPVTGMEESKRSWVVRIDGYVIGSGYYL